MVPEARWREMLAPDGTAPALRNQRQYVRNIVLYAMGTKPSLKHLTIGQADKILRAYQVDPAGLWANRRGEPGKNRLTLFTTWSFGILAFLVLCLIPVLGWIGAAVWIVVFVVKMVNRSKRQTYEDMLASTPPPFPAQQYFQEPAAGSQAPAEMLGDPAAGHDGSEPDPSTWPVGPGER
ncbi:hypothetical protein BMF89_00170 [Arthrobacter sp. SRS-W-1-2016]|nr:hypothetical protein BMF89_00170 [Arthrobacter sp. SRS-W-1-2016]